jgi:hypothetical protein
VSWGIEPGSQSEPDREFTDAQDKRAESGESPSERGSAALHPCDYEVRVFDPEELNATWSAVRPGVDYVEAAREAEHTAAAVRARLFPYLKHRDALDAVMAMVDLGGNPYLWLRLGTRGSLDLVELVRDGLRSRGELADEAG